MLHHSTKTITDKELWTPDQSVAKPLYSDSAVAQTEVPCTGNVSSAEKASSGPGTTTKRQG
ncbi:hypothetical protein GGF37_005793, partial [Kickxella alabastrina]